MARRIAATDPALALTFFLTGFYTNRSPLFAPYKALGVSIVVYREPLIDGANEENSDQLELVRRPGYSIFCAQGLFDSEVVNQFDSTRNLDGDVIPFFDSSVRFAKFDTTTITTLITKTVPDQGFSSTIGNMTYFSDGAGVDAQKWDSVAPLSTINPSSWGWLHPL